MKIRLDKWLSNMGRGTRTQVKAWIRRRAVTVNGQQAVSGSQIVDPDADVVELLGERVAYRRFVYLMMNKPAGVICATEDAKHRTVVELVGEEYAHYRLFPAGRLDIDTTGLVILTNDGELAHDILAPKKHIPKTYRVTPERPVSPEQTSALEAGVRLEDGTLCRPAIVEPAGAALHAPGCRDVLLTITEGKFHQVKRMFEAVGNRVTALKRVQMNKLPLDESLAPGEFRELSDEERELLVSACRR